MRHRLRVAGATREVFANGALREISRLSGGVPRLINIICDRALLGAFTEDRHVVSASVVRRAAGEVFGKTIQPRWLPWATGSAVGGTGRRQRRAGRCRVSCRPCAATATAVAAGARAGAKPAPPRISTSCWRSTARKPIRTMPSTSCSRCGACATWRAAADPCTQALQSGLECLTQRGSLAQLRLFNRPAVLNVVDSDGRAHQLVLAGLDDEHAQIDLGGAQREIGIGDLSRSWFGDYVLLWRPAGGGSEPLALGARNARVKWLRDSLRRVNGLPAEEPARTTASMRRW